MNSSDPFKEEALPLIIYNNDKRAFEVHDEAANFLKKLQAPLGIIAVAGMYRTGKSYLLNRMLLNRSGGFGVGPTINPCTKGLWVWGKPISGFTPEGEPIQVLVIDTEGLGALDEDSNHDVRVFSLAILLSSYFIYNSVGSIDENALQNLSLVINLTKHIQLKSKGMQDDIDPEEYSQYFPSFMWVVRDFALQLVDQEGEIITSKEYLEKALVQQKGFSDGVEQKNRIRRLLKTFFKERDCCTMIRPLTKEENLQNLENMELDDLRNEFIEQVMSLRRKVINRIKPKIVNGKKLNGEMLYNLLLSYVEAINKGAVPNIENAWSYICRNECQKASLESFDKFEKHLAENFDMQGPLDEYDLREIYKEGKKYAMEEFSKVAVGDLQKQYLEELKEKIRQKYISIKSDNEKLSEQQCLLFLSSSYQSIERKIKQGDYKSFYDVEVELRGFAQYFMESGPPGPDRRAILSEFIQKSLCEAAEFFCKNISNELYLQQQIAQDTAMKLTEELKEIKGEYRQKQDHYESKVRNLETEKAEISAKEQSLKESLSQVSKEKERLDVELREKIQAERKDGQRLLDEFKDKLLHSEEQAKEMNRQVMAAESEFEKQKALLMQKVEFMEKQHTENSKREQELSLELKNIKREHMNVLKDSSFKQDQMIKDLQKQIETLNDAKFELETTVSQVEQKYEQEKTKWEETEQQLRNQQSKNLGNNSDLQKQYDILKKKYVEEIDQLKRQTEDDTIDKSEQIQELESKLKLTEEQFSMQLKKWQKDEAILRQKIEFLELSVKDSKVQYEDQKKTHEQMLKSLQSKEHESSIGKEEATKRINELKDIQNREYKELEEKYDTIRNRLQQQVDQLQERNSELTLSLKIQVGDLEKEVITLKELLAISEDQKNKALEASKNLDQQKLKMLEEAELRYKNQIFELEQEREQSHKDYEEEERKMNEQCASQVEQLKESYKFQKELLEKRILDEKERAQKRYNQMVDDYETKLKEEQNNHEDELGMLTEEGREKENQLQDLVNKLDHQVKLQNQQIISLEKYLAETKESLGKVTSMNNNAIEQQLDKFNEERRELIVKIEKITGESTKKERLINTLENQKESLQSQMLQKEKQLQELKQENTSDKHEILEKLEVLRTKYQVAQDELTTKKIEFERDKALKSQQLQFQEQRLEELQKNLSDTINRYEERIRQDKEEMQKEYSERVSVIYNEKAISDKKFEEKRKQLKDLEIQQNKYSAQMEKEKAVMTEKQQNLENLQKDLTKNYESEIDKLRQSNEQLTLALSSDKSIIQAEVEKWKSDYQKLEQQFSDKHNNYDRDQALWEGKFKFLEQQKETAKKDLEDLQKKFTSTIEQLQKSQSDNQNKNETSAQIKMNQMEQAHKQMVKDMQENFQAKSTELTQKFKSLERENKTLSEKLEFLNKSKSSEHGSMEKRCEKLVEQVSKLEDDIETLKNDRDRKIIENQKALDKERELYKQKVKEIEERGSGQGRKTQDMLMTYEKDRVKWDQEKSNLMLAKDEAVENAQRLEKKVEGLLKDNEKLKVEMRNIRKNMYSASQNTTNQLSAGVGASLLGKLGGGFGTGGGYQPQGGVTSQTSRQFIGDGSGNKDLVSSSISATDKSFTGGAGAVGGLLNLGKKPESSSLMKNLMSTPQSNRSGGEDSFSGKGDDTQQ